MNAIAGREWRRNVANVVDTSDDAAWVNTHAALLVQQLADTGVTLPQERARQVIRHRLDTTARLLRTDRRAARPMVAADTVATMADDVLPREDSSPGSNVISLDAELKRRRSPGVSGLHLIDHRDTRT